MQKKSPKKPVKKTTKKIAKKTISIKQTRQVKRVIPVKQILKPVPASQPVKQSRGGWSASIYIYWFIILFFIAATFYILGRARSTYAPDKAPWVEEELTVTDESAMDAVQQHLSDGNIDGMISELSSMIDAGNAVAQTYVLRGEAYLQYGDYSNALSDFNSAINIDPEYAVGYYDRALLNMRLEDYSAALNDINNALALVANGSDSVLSVRDLYAKRGQINLWLKNWEGAIADYTHSLARTSGTINSDVYAERAEAYTAIGDYNAAIDDYSSAVRVISEQIQGMTTSEEREHASTNAMNYFEKSAALNLTLGNVDAARADLESALTIAGALNNSDTIEHLESLLNQLD